MTTDDVRCTSGEVRLLRPLDEMTTPVRVALTRWLWDHDITPTDVAVGLPIERDDVQNLLVWRENRPGGTIVKRWRFAAHAGDDLWPAPFPAVLTDVRAAAPATGATGSEGR